MVEDRLPDAAAAECWACSDGQVRNIILIILTRII